VIVSTKLISTAQPRRRSKLLSFSTARPLKWYYVACVRPGVENRCVHRLDCEPSLSGAARRNCIVRRLMTFNCADRSIQRYYRAATGDVVAAHVCLWPASPRGMASCDCAPCVMVTSSRGCTQLAGRPCAGRCKTWHRILDLTIVVPLTLRGCSLLQPPHIVLCPPFFQHMKRSHSDLQTQQQAVHAMEQPIFTARGGRGAGRAQAAPDPTGKIKMCMQCGTTRCARAAIRLSPNSMQSSCDLGRSD
jgi:hypothetical protein